MGEDGCGQIEHHLVQGEALAAVESRRVCQPKRKLTLFGHPAGLARLEVEIDARKVEEAVIYGSGPIPQQLVLQYMLTTCLHVKRPRMRKRDSTKSKPQHHSICV
jgi:hypothetical protein